MKFELTYSRETDHLLVRLTGVWDAQSAYQINARLADIVRQEKCYRMLIDARGLEITTGKAELYYIVAELRNLRADKMEKVATVMEGDDTRVAFYTTAARNRGINLQFFNDIDDARRWLTEP